MDYIVHEVAKNGHAERLSLSRVFLMKMSSPFPYPSPPSISGSKSQALSIYWLVIVGLYFLIFCYTFYFEVNVDFHALIINSVERSYVPLTCFSQTALLVFIFDMRLFLRKGVT